MVQCSIWFPFKKHKDKQDLHTQITRSRYCKKGHPCGCLTPRVPPDRPWGGSEQLSEFQAGFRRVARGFQDCWADIEQRHLLGGLPFKINQILSCGSLPPMATWEVATSKDALGSSQELPLPAVSIGFRGGPGPSNRDFDVWLCPRKVL